MKNIPMELREQLRNEAAANFRSITQEAMSRLERTFQIDAALTTKRDQKWIDAAIASGAETPLTKRFMVDDEDVPSRSLRSNRQQTHRSSAALFDEGLKLFPRESGLASAEGCNLLLRSLETFCRAPDLLTAPAAFGNETGHRLLMARDDDLLARNHAVEQLTELGFCFKCRNGRHKRSQTLSNQSVDDWSNAMAAACEAETFDGAETATCF
ncbi:MAG TPA: Arc family DNA-binding protein [Dongiaceae bacterium]|nr:Arc family DNA-binding protein [Dongiaceae bacterium]